MVCGNTKSKALGKGTLASHNLPNFTVHLSGNLMDNDGDGVLNGTDKGYSDKDGMPDAYESALGWNAAVQDHNTTDWDTSSNHWLKTSAPIWSRARWP